MTRRKARDGRVTEIRGKSGEVVSYNARFKYRDPATGKWKDRPKRHKSVEEAERWLREQDAAVSGGRLVEPSKELLGVAIDHWLRTKHDAGRISDSTLFNQRLQLAAVYGEIFGVALCDLEASHFEGEYARIKARGKPGGSVAAYTHSLLNGWFNRLVGQGRLATNPLAHVLAPVPDPKPKRAWDWPEVETFLAHQREAELYPLWLLLFEKKMRLGEAQALRWCDVEIDGAEGSGRCFISATLTRARDPHSGIMRWVVGERAKTPESIRVLMLGWELQLALRQHRDQAMFAARMFGRSWDDTHFIFANADGTSFMARETICCRLRAACKAAGVRRLSPHGLRRSGISRALGSKEPLFLVMEEAGHVDPKTTLGYTVFSEDEHWAATKRFAARVHGERAPRADDGAVESGG